MISGVVVRTICFNPLMVRSREAASRTKRAFGRRHTGTASWFETPPSEVPHHEADGPPIPRRDSRVERRRPSSTRASPLRLEPYEGSTILASFSSPGSLYDSDLVTSEEGELAYDHRDAAGSLS